VQDRKYFDSGDYALSKAGVEPTNTVGTAIPNPEKCAHRHPNLFVLALIFVLLYSIPHASSPSNGHAPLSVSPTNPTSPVNKESGLSHTDESHDPLDDNTISADS
jgi:hypothetical protein